MTKRWPPNWHSRLVCVCLAVALVGCTTEVLHGLTEADANRAVTLLEAQGIAAHKARDRRGNAWQIDVPSRAASQAFEVLAAEGVPGRQFPDPEDLAGDDRLLPSRQEEARRAQFATAAGLEATLITIPGILDARVHVATDVSPPQGMTDGPAAPDGAAVLLTTGSDLSPDAVAVADVQGLVAAALVGVDRRDVTVVVVPRIAPVPSPQVLDRVGPFGVTAASRTLLQGTLLGFCVLVLGLSLALGRFIMLRRRAQVQ